MTFFFCSFWFYIVWLSWLRRTLILPLLYSSLLSCPYYYYRRRRTSPATAPSQLQECFQVQRRRCLRLACWWCSWPLGAFQPDGPKPTTDANSPAIYSTNTNCRPIKSLSVRTLSWFSTKHWKRCCCLLVDFYRFTTSRKSRADKSAPGYTL